MTAFKQCESRVTTPVFSHYEYGDEMWPVFIGEDEAVTRENGIRVYVRCEREVGHAGKHLARQTRGWSDAEAHV